MAAPPVLGSPDAEAALDAVLYNRALCSTENGVLFCHGGEATVEVSHSAQRSSRLPVQPKDGGCGSSYSASCISWQT